MIICEVSCQGSRRVEGTVPKIICSEEKAQFNKPKCRNIYQHASRQVKHFIFRRRREACFLQLFSLDAVFAPQRLHHCRASVMMTMINLRAARGMCELSVGSLTSLPPEGRRLKLIIITFIISRSGPDA